MEIQVSMEELVQELANRCAQLELDLATAQILIRKLQAGPQEEEPHGQANGQEKELTQDQLVRNTKPAEVSNS